MEQVALTKLGQCAQDVKNKQCLKEVQSTQLKYILIKNIFYFSLKKKIYARISPSLNFPHLLENKIMENNLVMWSVNKTAC